MIMARKVRPLLVPTETVRLHFSNINTRPTPASANGIRRRRYIADTVKYPGQVRLDWSTDAFTSHCTLYCVCKQHTR